MAVTWEVALACVGGALLAVLVLVLVCWVRRRRHLAAGKEPLLPSNGGKERHSPSSKTPPALKGTRPIEFVVPKTVECPMSLPGAAVQAGGDQTLLLPAMARLHERRRSSLAAPVNMDELDLAMYGEGSAAQEDLRGLGSGLARGRLCFTVAYDTAHEYLIVNVLRAVHLVSNFGTKPPDTYVHLRLKPVQKDEEETVSGSGRRLGEVESGSERPPACTAVVRGSASPQFDQSFCLPLEGGAASSTNLVLTVAEYDRFSQRTRLGRIRFPLFELAKYPEFQALPEVWRDLLPGDEMALPRGEVLVSLSRHKNAIGIGLLELKDIAPRGLATPMQEAAYLYVRLSLVSRDQVLKRRRSRLVHFGACAVINEEFNLEVNEDDLHQMAFSVAVCCRNACGRSVVLGKACTGSLMFTSGASLQHWQDAMRTRNRLVEHWHVLH